MSGSHSFEKRQPKRQFLWLVPNIGGAIEKYRMTLDTYRDLKPTSGMWAYEADGEAGVYPTMEQWNAIHGDGGCPTPCSRCDAAGYDPLTGKTKGDA